MPVTAELVEKQLVSEEELIIRREAEFASAGTPVNSWKREAGMERFVLRMMRNEEEISA